ncbi:MAG: biotin/lipoyl-binding protein, partial [Acidobacteria bacterium]
MPPEDLPAGASRARALHHHRAAAHVQGGGASARPHQERPSRGHPGGRLGHVGAAPSDGRKTHADAGSRGVEESGSRRVGESGRVGESRVGEAGVGPQEKSMTTMKTWLTVAAALLCAACQENAPATGARVSGQADATDVQIAPEVGGRIVELMIQEGDRVKRGDVIARLDSRDADLALQRAKAERAQADAQLRLLQAGSRPEDIRQAEAQAAAVVAEVAAAQADLEGAETDLQRFERLLQSNSGSQKQRDDAATRRDMARDRLTAARAREAAARAAVARLRSGSRREEIEAARARVAAVDAQIATLEKSRSDATVASPVDGIVTERLLDLGEMVAPRAPIAIVTDLDRAWAEVFVDEPMIPRITLGQTATVFTDAGGPGIPGKV